MEVSKKNKKINKIFDDAISTKKNIHLMGLVSDGGVHSHISHLYELIDIVESKKEANAFIHAFTDGRDVDPKSAIGFIEKLENFLKHKKTKLASICGRYYAMDRDKRWDRVKKSV